MSTEIERLEAEIVKRDARIAELEKFADEANAQMLEAFAERDHALKAQQLSAGVVNEREAFDEWFNDFSLSVRMNGGQMNDALMFAAWQARARLTLTPTGDGVVLPERADENEGNSYSVMQAMARNQTIDEVARLNPCRAQAVPEGYVLVPVEPTLEMMKASKRELEKSPVIWCRYKAAYRALLAAAPSAQQPGIAQAAQTCHCSEPCGEYPHCPAINK